jgi:hypothetical protein
VSPITQYLLLSLIGGLPAGLFAMLCYAKCRELENAQKDLRHALNSRLDELMKTSGLLQRAEGRREGIDSTKPAP